MSPGAYATSPKASPSKNVRLFHVIEKDEIDFAFSAFDNKGNVVVIIPECPEKISNGKLVEKKTYLIKDFRQEGPIVTIARYSSCTIWPNMEFPQKKLTGEMETHAKDLLREHGGVSIATAKNERTKYDASLIVHGEVIRMGPVQLQKNSRTNLPYQLQNVRIRDQMGNMRVTLFKDRTDTLVKGRSYRFRNVTKKEFNQHSYLHTGNSYLRVTDIDPIKDPYDGTLSQDEEEEIAPISRTLSA